jgi:hypothetical protein
MVTICASTVSAPTCPPPSPESRSC